jgi:limonene-1,2-epoxide hydrolase
MPSPTETVTAFLALWEKPNGFEQAVHAYFTAETRWENVGMTNTVGPEAALNAFPSMGGASLRVDTLALASTGDKVLTERIDHILGPNGEPAMSIPVMGIFEVKDGKIAAWRDYFDTAGFQQQG